MAEARSRSAEFVRDVAASESLEMLINDCKALTWSDRCEHAVLTLEGGRRILVKGGPFGIDLPRSVLDDPFGRPPDALWIDVGDTQFRVARLEMHSHPQPTGPSDDDRVVLAVLNQASSLLIEIGGADVDGQEFGPEKDG